MYTRVLEYVGGPLCGVRSDIFKPQLFERHLYCCAGAAGRGGWLQFKGAVCIIDCQVRFIMHHFFYYNCRSELVLIAGTR